jgi:hypothetical protein
MNNSKKSKITNKQKIIILIGLLIFGITIYNVFYSPEVLSCKYIDGIEYSSDRTQFKEKKRDGFMDIDIVLEIYKNQNKIIEIDSGGRSEFKNKTTEQENFYYYDTVNIQKNLILFSYRMVSKKNPDTGNTEDNFSLDRLTGILTKVFGLPKELGGLFVLRYQCSKKTNLF